MMPIQKIIHSRKNLKRIDDLTIFITINYHKIIYYETKLLKRSSTYEKFRRNLGEQQNMSELLGFFRSIWDISLFLGHFRIFRRRGDSVKAVY